MKIEVQATGTNVEDLLQEYMRGATASAVMGRVQAASLALSRASTRHTDAILWGAFADWCEAGRNMLRKVEDDACDARRTVGQTEDQAFTLYFADAIKAGL